MNLLRTIDQYQPAVLALADGSIFSGYSIGASGSTVGEVVFNTAMTGYQEVLTDPSYAEQIVTLTYPHIGNVGVNPEDMESDRAWASGLIIKESSLIPSNYRAVYSLPEFLRAQNIVAIAGIDTRRLTRLLRNKGTLSGCITTDTVDVDASLAAAREYDGLEGKDLTARVSVIEQCNWTEGTLTVDDMKPSQSAEYHVVVYDFGVKRQILRLLIDHNCRVTLVPAKMSIQDVMALKPDGVLLSNGPGDPAACDKAIKTTQQLLEYRVPILGICLGFQLLALACGARTFKMKFGHHGANHPVKNLIKSEVMITSQNHSFAVDEDSLPPELAVTHRSLFDGTLQGLAHQSKPALGFQGHPESSPGPHDAREIFKQFTGLMRQSCRKEQILKPS